MAEGNFRAWWSEIPTYSEKYSNFINSQGLIYVCVVAAIVDVIFILIVVQLSPLLHRTQSHKVSFLCTKHMRYYSAAVSHHQVGQNEEAR